MKTWIVIIAIFSVSFTTWALPQHEINQYKQSWVAKALGLQRLIDKDAPLNESTFIGTHNSYNSHSYHIPMLRYVDPNHTLSIYEQLELGVRSLELDVHWSIALKAKKDFLLCHGKANHLGCSPFDRPVQEGLDEIKWWLTANPHEIVLLYIEKYLDGHEPQLATLLNESLGRFIFTPTFISSSHKNQGSCTAIPSSLTKADIAKAGKQLLIVTKECSNDAYIDEALFSAHWNDVVFAGIGDIPEKAFTFIDSSIGEEFKPYPHCVEGIFDQDVLHTSLWRIFEDRTKLSNIVSHKRQLLADDMKELLQCHINWPSMDMLVPNDARLTAAVWSWAPLYPVTEGGRCAVYKQHIGIQNQPCEQVASGFACEKRDTHSFDAVPIAGRWEDGEVSCQQLGNAWHFSMPVNAARMHALKSAVEARGLHDVWVNYALDDSFEWVVPR